MFESAVHVRKYTLNREKQLNALNEPMLNLLRPYVEVCMFLQGQIHSF